MSILNPLEFYLCPQPEETVFTATVASTPSDPYTSISYSSGVTGSFGAPLAGQTVEFVGRGKRRLKTYSGGAAGTIGIDESDDVGPIIQAGDSIRIYNQFRLWPKYPRFVQSGTQVTIFADYDEAYTNHTNQWRSTANAGPPGVGFLSGGTATVQFVGDRSQTHAAGATITSYLWTARDSNEGTSTSQGTEASPVEFTWTSPGWYLVSLKVTDSNGQTHTNYTYVIIIDPANPTESAFVDFDTFSDSFDFEQGGGTAGFTVRGDASTTNFPEEGLILHVCRGTQTTTTGSWPFREDVLFVGWIMHDTVRQNPDTGEVSFRAATIDSIMKNLSVFPASLTDKTTPVDWTQGKDLTVDRCTSFLAKHWSTLDLMTPLVFSGDTRLIRRQDFGPTNLYANLQNNLVGSILGHVVSSHQGVLYLEIDYNVRNTSERAQASTHKTLHKGVWANDVFVEERADYEWPANQVEMSGIYYPGGEIEDICPLFSEAPGDAMKAYGREHNFDRLILSSQTDLNIRSGHMLEKLNQRYPQYREAFFNDAAFAIVPQALYPVIIESGDNDRSLSRSINVIPRKINRTYNHENGYYQVDVEFEPETSGQPGVTVDIPCGPPEQKLSGTVPPPPAGVPGKLGLMAGTTGTSWYFARGIEQTWERRVQGLADPDNLSFEDAIADPWTAFKQGYNVENIIVWGSGRGFVERSRDTGKNWSDRSSNLEPGPMWPNETGSVSSTVMLRLEADVFAEDRLYVLGVWREGGNYRTAIAETTDGFDYDWFNVTGSAQARGLGMSLDGGNGGTLYVTTWESDPTGTIYLRAFNTSDMSLAGQYSLGEASEGEIDAQTYYASPFNTRGQTNEVYVFGRMQQPQGFTGTVHVLKNTSAGATGSWSVIENTWGADLCNSFGADSDGYYYAVRGGPATGGDGSPTAPPATSTWSAGGSDPSTIGNTNDGNRVYGFLDSDPFTIREYNLSSETNQDVHTSGDTTGSLLASSYIVAFKGNIYMGTYETNRVRIYRYSGTPNTWNEVFDSGVVSGLSAEENTVLWATSTHLIFSAGNNGSSPYVRASSDGDSWASFSLSDNTGDDPSFETDGFASGTPHYTIGDKQYTGLSDEYILTASGKRLLKWTGSLIRQIDDAADSKYRYLPSPYHHWRVDTTAGALHGNFSTWAYRRTAINTNGFEDGWISSPAGPGGETVVPIATIGGNYPAGLSRDGDTHYLHWFYDGQWSDGEEAFTHSNSTSMDEPAVQCQVLDSGTVCVSYHIGFGSTNFAIRDNPV